MPLFDFVCNKCSYNKEELFYSADEVVDEIDCDKCDGKMERQFGAASYLGVTSDTNIRIHKAEKTMGTGNLEPKQLPKNTGPRMWPANKGKILGQTPK